MRENSEMVSKMIGMVYPFIILFGFYIVLNGHVTPGGGFQGGAVLSAVFMCRYLVVPIHDIRLNSLQMIEKMVYILIVAVPTVFLLSKINFMYPFMNKYYLIVMNSLIGIKVCCGLSIIFFRFVFYESR